MWWRGVAFYEQKVLGVNNMIKSYTAPVGAVWMEIFARGFIACALAEEAPNRQKNRVASEEGREREKSVYKTGNFINLWCERMLAGVGELLRLSTGLSRRSQ